MLFSTVPYPPPPDVAWRLLNIPATYSDTHLAASLVVSHTVLSGTFSAEWTTDAWIGAQFTTLTIPHTQLYDENDALIAGGAVQAVASPPTQAGEGAGGYAPQPKCCKPRRRSPSR